MQSRFSLFLALYSLMAVILSGCSKDEKSKNVEESYEFEENRCSTKSQTFKAGSEQELLQLLCAGLKDEKRNGSCAQELRCSTFKQRCSSQTWQGCTDQQAGPRTQSKTQQKPQTQTPQGSVAPCPSNLPACKPPAPPSAEDVSKAPPPPPPPGHSPKKPSEPLPQLSYQFSDNECSTGYHKFSGPNEKQVKAEYCAALLDEAKNNNCAYHLRDEAHRKACNH